MELTSRTSSPAQVLGARAVRPRADAEDSITSPTTHHVMVERHDPQPVSQTPCTLITSSVPGVEPSTTLLPPVSTPLRRSGRHAMASDGSSCTDQYSMAKSMRRKAKQNLDNAGIDHSAKSFLAFSNSSISANLNKVLPLIHNKCRKI